MHFLVMRFSAMGDVALTVPALRAALEGNDDLRLTVATRPLFAPFFSGLPRTRLFTPDLKEYPGLGGLRRLYHDLRAGSSYDAVLDLHDVLRTKILRRHFRRTGVPVHVIDKGRREKRLLLWGVHKGPLRHTVERYLDVFRAAGITPAEVRPPYLKTDAHDLPAGGDPAVGFAPTARHPLKWWPPHLEVAFLKELPRHLPGVVVYLFGGPDEEETLRNMAREGGSHVRTVCTLPLERQLALMQQMKVVVTMDSANMHMATLLGVPVVSVWGATHPWAGFGPWQGDERLIVQIPREELRCRPCTIYGKGSCRRRDLACLHRITPDRVIEKVLLALKPSRP